MATQYGIVVVESSPALGRELADLIGAALHASVRHHSTLVEAAADVEGADLVLLDWTMLREGQAGLQELLRKFASPCLLVTGASEAQLRTSQSGPAGHLFEALERPFRFTTLVARLRELLRQRWDAVGPRLGRFRYDQKAKLLVPDHPGDPIRLTEKEAEILNYLYHQDGSEVDREGLLRALWKLEPGVTTHTLETHIYRLRQKLEIDPSNARILMTVNGGYRLVTSSAQGVAGEPPAVE